MSRAVWLPCIWVMAIHPALHGRIHLGRPMLIHPCTSTLPMDGWIALPPPVVPARHLTWAVVLVVVVLTLLWLLSAADACAPVPRRHPAGPAGGAQRLPPAAARGVQRAAAHVHQQHQAQQPGRAAARVGRAPSCGGGDLCVHVPPLGELTTTGHCAAPAMHLLGGCSGCMHQTTSDSCHTQLACVSRSRCTPTK